MFVRTYMFSRFSSIFHKKVNVNENNWKPFLYKKLCYIIKHIHNFVVTLKIREYLRAKNENSPPFHIYIYIIYPSYTFMYTLPCGINFFDFSHIRMHSIVSPGSGYGSKCWAGSYLKQSYTCSKLFPLNMYLFLYRISIYLF